MFLLNVFVAEELSVGIYLSICLFVCLSACLSVFYTLCSCRFVFWWLAVPWWARNKISTLSAFPLLHCASPCGDSLIMSLVRWWSHGNYAGNLADSGRDELQSLPLHLKIPFMSDYSQLSTLLFAVSIQQQRLLRLQYPQRFPEQHFFTVKTSRANRTNRLWGPCRNVVHKAYNISSYSTQFRETTVVFSFWHVL